MKSPDFLFKFDVPGVSPEPETETETDKKIIAAAHTKSPIIDSKKLMYSVGGNDECYTPAYAVAPILEYIPPGAIIWCPFDTPASEFVKQISLTNKVEYSHIINGQDFFEYEPPAWDILISNPPFTNKRKYFERAITFKKPFALIMTNTWLNDSAPKQLFKYIDLQLLMFDKRMKFNQPDGRDNDKITFSSSYYCWGFLPKQIIMKELAIPKLEKAVTDNIVLPEILPSTDQLG